MRHAKVSLLTLGVAVIVMTIGAQSCATKSPETMSTTGAQATATAPGPTMGKSDLIFQYREQAADLRAMARRLEFETEVYAQHQDQQQTQRSRDLAKEMRSAADTADEQAREYRRQLPHNQVY
jgi:hypothetical protein